MAIGEIVLGSFLASFFQVLFDKLTSSALSCAQQDGINTVSLEEWKDMLLTINAVLADAENKQLSGNHQVKLWLDKVKDLAYDMEDLLDEFAIKAAQIELQVESSTSLQKWKSLFLGQPHSLVSKTKIQEINGKLVTLVTGKDNLSLTKNVTDKANFTSKRDPTTSLPESQFFGREEEEAQILELLINEVQNSDAMLRIIPIVGMGGIGKTALAQRLYNDARVNRCFHRKAWVCVSDVFDVFDITKNIFHSITGLSWQDKDLNGLQVKLRDSLSGKKFLVVLDDIWNDKYGRWTAILKPFEAGARGSKIIITTRNRAVASITKTLPYCLKELSLENCTNLLAFHALGEINFESHSKFEKICKKIAKRCKGLPLAAKMLGGALRSITNPDEWEDTLNNIIRDPAMVEDDEVLPILTLSYVHLPSYLKRCFSYCAIFPKDYEIERDELVLLWIAEGFLDGQKKNKNKLKLGRSYFNELVSRSFLQQSSVDTSKFSMHDLLNDLAKSIEGAICFSSGESQVVVNEDDASLGRARYASFVSSWFVTSKCLRAYHGLKVLRSLILVRVGSSRGPNKFSISNKVLHDLLTNLKYLRVFSLCHCSIVEVPNCVAGLKHLRYLNFSYTDIERLPESFGDLCKLQALILRGCHRLSKLPHGITKLVNLQFLDIRDTKSLKEMPLGINNLKNLTILSKFVVGTEKGLPLKELENLSHLQGELFISELQNVKDVKDCVDAKLSRKEGLSNLFLQWDKDFRNLWNDKHYFQGLDFLQPHTNLENLTISYYGGAKFPPWLNCPSYSKIVSLCFLSCPNVTSLPSLGQLPSLRELSFEGLDAVTIIGSEFYGGKKPFSSLITLKFKEMLAWKDWSPYAKALEEVPFSCLQHLVVQNCPSLVGTLPYQLNCLVKLEIHSCLQFNNPISEVYLPSLDELYIKDCSKEILKRLANLTSLTILKIESIIELVSFDHGFMSYMGNLKKLHIGQCDKLTFLWQDGDETRNLTCLQELVIKKCPQFISFVVGGGEIELSYNLERMELVDCTSLEKLPRKMHTLRHLVITNCPKIMELNIPQDDSGSNNPISQLDSLRISGYNSPISFSFAKGRLAPLKALSIRDCKEVESIEGIAIELLEKLRIHGCENMGSLSQCLHTLSHLIQLHICNCTELEIEDFPPLPITLSSFKLFNCSKIKSIANCNIANCNNLTKLVIWECPVLEIEDFPPLPITLQSLELWDCPMIKSLPNKWHHLTSLQVLRIVNCQNIKCFPKGGLPPKLRDLGIMGLVALKQPVREWGLHLLTSLESLAVAFNMGGEGEKEWFPLEDKDAWSLFPSSLTSLRIYHLRNAERLSSGLRNRLSSLRWLSIGECPKLRYLPEDGFPPSLQHLHIYQCKILEERCAKLIGDYWPLIEEIPDVHIW